MSKVIGIDVSKATLDVAFLENDVWKHFSVSNDKSGFKKIIDQVGINSHCVMEASGAYYLQLAIYLFDHSIKVSVVNPLVIKRYSQMRLIRAKTDKKDAQTIAEYGTFESPALWMRKSEVTIKMQQLLSSIELLKQKKTSFSNQLEAFTCSGIIDREVKKTLKSVLKKLEASIMKLEYSLSLLVEENYKDTYERLVNIPGIGPKTAAILIAITDNFKKFNNYKQLIAYVGFSPRIYQSGTSVRGKGHICKMGKAQVRKLLYMCTWKAKSCNQGCVQMYERLAAKGKPERVIKVALANKLLKQAFAIAVSQTNYNENYVSKPCF